MTADPKEKPFREPARRLPGEPAQIGLLPKSETDDAIGILLRLDEQGAGKIGVDVGQRFRNVGARIFQKLSSLRRIRALHGLDDVEGAAKVPVDDDVCVPRHDIRRARCRPVAVERSGERGLKIGRQQTIVDIVRKDGIVVRQFPVFRSPVFIPEVCALAGRHRHRIEARPVESFAEVECKGSGLKDLEAS